MIFFPADLTKLTDVRLDILNLQCLAEIKRQINRNPGFKRIIDLSNAIEDEQERRAAIT